MGADDDMVHGGGVAHVGSNGEWVVLLCGSVSPTHGERGTYICHHTAPMA